MHLNNFKNCSFSTKIASLFFLFVFFFMFIRFVLIIPNIEKESLNNEIKNISNALEIVKQQSNIISKSVVVQSNLEKTLIKEKIEHQIKNFDLHVTQLSKENLILQISNNSSINQCSYKLSDAKQTYKISNKEIFIFENDNFKIFNQWKAFHTSQNSRNFKATSYLIYKHYFANQDLTLLIACDNQDLNPSHVKFAESLKTHISSALSIDTSLKNTKIAFFWIAPNIDTNSNEILRTNKQVYAIATPSNVKILPTGNLSIKEVFALRDKNPIEHTLNGREVLTWIVDLTAKTMNRNQLLCFTVDKEELKNKNSSKIFFLLPEIFAIGISFILMSFIFRRALKEINILTKTAKEVNKGNKSIRSNLQGNDDIGILGQSFDSMLDFFENSIKELDKKVTEKTKEIQHSLEEKEILLKEIHHRVKNNLAFTISLIELQENKIDNEKTKHILTNIKERIYAMELLHRKLYESANLSNIVFKEYIQDLVKSISTTYKIDTQSKIVLEIEEINLNIQSAMPYGLILNELVTNAFKYAFTKSDRFFLKISACKKDDTLTIIVQDNGAGLKDDFHKICSETLGLKLVNLITTLQLKGNFSYEYNQGACFRVEGKFR